MLVGKKLCFKDIGLESKKWVLKHVGVNCEYVAFDFVAVKERVECNLLFGRFKHEQV